MATPMIDKFLGELKSILESKEGERLQQYLLIEPPFSGPYVLIVEELRARFPAGSHDKLEKKCENSLPEYEDMGIRGGSWPAFINFLIQYFLFLRDVDASKLVETHDMIKSLVTQSVLALSDSMMGVVVLPTVIALSRQLSTLSIALENNPDLIATHKTPAATTFANAGSSDATERVTLVESSANAIREAFSKCLSERAAGGPDAPGPPAGRRVGIYVLANMCLRLFFHARKLRSAEQIFGNIYQQSPPLDRFPASQRVAFLYYLGRYNFANNHFMRAEHALAEAYKQCHKQCLSQRRRILVYLVASNLILGRFPSASLLSRPEAQQPVPLRDIFLPICNAIKLGNLDAFHRALDMNSPAGSWLLRQRILLQIRNRCEVLVWRTLARRVFLLSGFKGDANSKSAPRLDIIDTQTVASMLVRALPALKNPLNPTTTAPYIDPDFEGMDGIPGTNEAPNIALATVEGVIASLVRQGLLHGYMSHKHLKFVITGAKTRPATEAGFPVPWTLIKEKDDGEVPGWVTETRNGRPKPGGRVVRLSGARVVGT